MNLNETNNITKFNFINLNVNLIKPSRYVYYEPGQDRNIAALSF